MPRNAVRPAKKAATHAEQREIRKNFSAMPGVYGVSSGNQALRELKNHPPSINPTNRATAPADAAWTGRPDPSAAGTDGGVPPDPLPDHDGSRVRSDFGELGDFALFLDVAAPVGEDGDFLADDFRGETSEPSARTVRTAATDSLGAGRTETSTGNRTGPDFVTRTYDRRYRAGEPRPRTVVEVPNLLRPSENSQCPLAFGGSPSTRKETGQEVEDWQSNRYFPSGRRSTPAEGTMTKSGAGGTGGRESPADPVAESVRMAEGAATGGGAGRAGEFPDGGSESDSEDRSDTEPCPAANGSKGA